MWTDVGALLWPEERMAGDDCPELEATGGDTLSTSVMGEKRSIPVRIESICIMVPLNDNVRTYYGRRFLTSEIS